ESQIFPIENLTKLKPGSHSAQAVVHLNQDLNYPNAPGDLYGPVTSVTIDPAGGVVKLEINDREPDEEQRADTSAVKYLKLPSPLLTEFHGRPMFLRAAVVLPRDFEKHPEKKYPLRVHVGGYGERCTSSLVLAAQRPAKGPEFISLMLDGAGPL